MCESLHNEYVSKLSVLNRNAIPIEPYINSRTSIKHKCLVCNNIFSSQPNKMVERDKRCPICFPKRIKWNQELFISKLKEIRPTIKLISQFKNINDSITIQCTDCDYTWTSNGKSILGSTNCPRCGEIRTCKKTTDEFQIELNNLYNNTYLVLDEYITNLTPIRVQHKCGMIYLVSPVHLLMGRYQCTCEVANNSSTQEDFMANELSLNTIPFNRNVKLDNILKIRHLTFDFSILDSNILIEVDGLFHFRKFQANTDKDMKIAETELAQTQQNDILRNNNIPSDMLLIRIDYLTKPRHIQSLVKLIKLGRFNGLTGVCYFSSGKSVTDTEYYDRRFND